MKENVLIDEFPVLEQNVPVKLLIDRKFKTGLHAEVWLARLETGQMYPEVHFRFRDEDDSVCTFTFKKTIKEDIIKLPDNVYLNLNALFKTGIEFDWSLISAISCVISKIARVEFSAVGVDDQLQIVLSIDNDGYYDEIILSDEEMKILFNE